MNFNELYSHITGELIDSSHELNIFAKNKKCAALYKTAYDLKQSICERLNSDDDSQLCELTDILNEITKETALAVYNYMQKQSL